MAKIPTFSSLYEEIQNDLKFAFGITSFLGRTFLIPFSKVFAGLFKIAYVVADRVEKNMYPDNCDDEMLLRAGIQILGRKMFPAIQGEYLCSVTGSAGSIISAKQQFTDTFGNIYILDTEYTLDGVDDEINVRALNSGGDALPPDADLTSVSPLNGVNDVILVVSTVVEPTEEESIYDYRIAVNEYNRVQLQGGSRADFRIWGNEISGVRNVYPYVLFATEVTLYIEADSVDSVDGNGTPSQALLDAVKDNIEPSKIPVGTSKVYYLPILPNGVAITINNSDASYTTALSNAIKEYLLDIRAFIDGVDSLTQKRKGELRKSAIENIIFDITGGNYSTVDMLVNGSNVSNYTFEYENIPYLFSLTVLEA